MLNADYLISSQADDYLTRPRAPHLSRRTWKFVFLQHGVIHNDLSRWLNAQPVRLMISTTEAEHRSIIRPASPYLYSDKEVERTGLPRHDRLLELARGRSDRQRSILIAPTWRDYLLARQNGGHHRELAVDLVTTPFFLNWSRLLADPRLSEVAERAGLELFFLAHPHLQAHLPAELLPSSVRVVTAADVDIQKLIVQSRVMITDYSSMAFDAAYLEVPSVYYQFDAVDFFSGRHTVRAGEFRHRRDGFGPVVTEPSEVIAATAELLDPRSATIEKYRHRMRRTFTFRDGECSRRVYEAIRRREIPVADPLTGSPRLESDVDHDADSASEPSLRRISAAARLVGDHGEGRHRSTLAAFRVE